MDTPAAAAPGRRRDGSTVCHLPLFKVIHAHCNGPSVPSPRSGHRAVTDGVNVYVFGGYFADPQSPSDSARLFSEIWCLHLPTLQWREIKTTGIAPDRVASSCVLLLGCHIAVFGGSGVLFGSSNSNDLHLCDLRNGHWQKVETNGQLPDPAYGQSLVHCRSTNKLYLFGGTSGLTFYNSVHTFDIASRTWSKVSTAGNVPSERYRHEIAFDEDGFYVIGGGTGNAVYSTSEIYRFEFSTSRWTVIECAPDDTHGLPPPRRSHACCSAEGVIFMSGGITSDDVPQASYLSDIWRLKLPREAGQMPQWTRMPFSLTGPTYFHSATLTKEKCMIVFGGCILKYTGPQRTNKAYCMWVDVPPLQDMAWYCLKKYFPNILHLPPGQLHQLGIPQMYFASM